MNAREIGFDLLKEICVHKKYSNLLLRNELERAKDKDKGFITQLVYGTLQNYRYVRFLWERYVSKLPDIDVCILLDMSVYQMLYMDKVPSYAIINEAVSIAKKQINQKYGTLVNAVLHKVEGAKEIAISGSPEEILGIQTSHPTWLVSMWSAQYGFAIAKQICESNMENKASVARVNTLKTSVDELLEHACFTKAHISQDALIYQGTSLASSSYYQEGLVSIQDEASQLVAFMVDPQPKERILDVCSAPGTKSTHMAQLMQNEGEIVCGDIHPHRVELIAQGAQRLGITILKPVVQDATMLDELEEESFDRVLCDVPCSGYGVLARKSDIKYHMDSSDMDTLIPLQQLILERASKMVKQGGVLVYSTCTLNKKENEKQIVKFLKNNSAYELLNEQTIFPFAYHSDGFYMAKMKKTF